MIQPTESYAMSFGLLPGVTDAVFALRNVLCQVDRCQVHKCRVDSCQLDKCQMDSCKVDSCQVDRCQVDMQGD